MTDLGEAPPYFRPNWGPKGWKIFFLDWAPPLISGSGCPTPPPPFLLTWRSGSATVSYQILVKSNNWSIINAAFWAGLFKAGLTYPKVSTKFEFRYESLKSKFSLILFVYNLVIKYSKQNKKIFRENVFNEKKKRPGLKFNPGLALTGLRTTGPWLVELLLGYML